MEPSISWADAEIRPGRARACGEFLVRRLERPKLFVQLPRSLLLEEINESWENREISPVLSRLCICVCVITAYRVSVY